MLRDLFARDDESGVWFEDPVLLAKLATEKLQAAADELATRWKWAVAMVEVEWGDTARYGRIEPHPPSAPLRRRPRSGSWKPARPSSPSSTTTSGSRRH